MSRPVAARVAAALGFLAVALGAFGAHALRDTLARHGTAHVWETAVLYQFIHAVVLFMLAERPEFPRLAGWSFLCGIVLFSGSLYLLAVTDVRWLGYFTPVGGVGFLVGWSALIFCRRR